MKLKKSQLREFIREELKKQNLQERVEPSDTINAFFRIANAQQARKVDKVLVDVQTATLVSQLWDMAGDGVKQKMNKLKAKELGTTAWKVAGKLRK